MRVLHEPGPSTSFRKLLQLEIFGSEFDDWPAVLMESFFDAV